MTAPTAVPATPRLISLFDREGTSVRSAKSIDEIVQAAGLGFQVEKAPLYVVERIPAGDDVVEKIAAKPSAYVTRRADTKQEFGVVGPDYEVVQAVDAFRVCEPLLDAGMIQPVSAGSFHQGADPYFQFEWNLRQFTDITESIYSALGVKAFGLIAGNHAGRRKIAVGNCDTRVACQNTLAIATTEVIEAGGGVTHRAGAGERLIEVARRVWERVIASHQRTAQEYDLLARTYLSESDFKALVLDYALPVPALLTRDLNEKSAAITRRLNTIERIEAGRARVHDLWHNGIGHTGGSSAWEAYNGLAQAIDHDNDTFTVNAKTSRLQAAYTGALAEKKGRVYAALLAFARAG